MTFQILLNLLLASVWMMLHDRWDINSFSIGYLVGMGIIWLLRRFFPDPFYVKRLWAILKLVFLFIRELISSTIVVIRQVTRPRLNIRPGIFKFHTELQSDWEITLLSMLITLTPGSVVMEIAPREGIVYVHAMDADEFERGVMASKRIFENAIREVTGK
jgi:multicomponent Na+:H+ antiporter subunit E